MKNITNIALNLVIQNVYQIGAQYNMAFAVASMGNRTEASEYMLRGNKALEEVVKELKRLDETLDDR